MLVRPPRPLPGPRLAVRRTFLPRRTRQQDVPSGGVRHVSAPVQVGPSPSGGGPVPSSRRGPSNRPLTPRQLDALTRAAAGQTHQQIARAMGIDESSVGKMMTEVFRKLGAVNMPNAVLLACGAGILKPRRRHGDHAGFAAHRYRGEEPCEACWEGERAYRRDRRAARKANAA
ncbi:helix-turn-helix transcriptional regulator [Streptomyces caniscabiei]|uniref:helix-turn-helix transcriptional regulator n=1 Tax=Streptomyces caniscabiei TaxID=2746961 RepID=UPI0038D3A59D